MTAKDIANALDRNYETSEYCAHNIYFFSYPYHETDFLIVGKSGYIYDVEIKISRADFKADFKKVEKHKIIKDGTSEYTKSYFCPATKKYISEISTGKRERPNRFYYACPEGLIQKEEVPTYAGLLWIKDEKVEKIKEAPLLHKDKIPYHERLCRKFYFATKDIRQYRQNNGIDILKRQLNAALKEAEQNRCRAIEESNKNFILSQQLRECEKKTPL